MACVNTLTGRMAHKNLMQDFLKYLNDNSSNFILKGGTSLMLCYSLGRFSEDLDFDGYSGRKIASFVEKFCASKGITCRLAKNTDTVERLIIHYPVEDQDATLKVEVSYRAVQDDIKTVCGIKTYSVNKLLHLKCAAFLGREKLRDLYDILNIYKNYKLILSDSDISTLKLTLTSKDSKVVLDILDEQKDPLIDNDSLGALYIDVCGKLGITI